MDKLLRYILKFFAIIISISLFSSCRNTPKIEDYFGAEYEEISRETIDTLRAIVAAQNRRKDSLKREREIADSIYFKKLQQDYFDGKTTTTNYAYDGHPGTKPDDPMFGFDPWDDWDDAYNLERNDIDPYPDEW